MSAGKTSFLNMYHNNWLAVILRVGDLKFGLHYKKK
jgi:hypothetical protein